MWPHAGGRSWSSSLSCALPGVQGCANMSAEQRTGCQALLSCLTRAAGWEGALEAEWVILQALPRALGKHRVNLWLPPRVLTYVSGRGLKWDEVKAKDLETRCWEQSQHWWKTAPLVATAPSLMWLCWQPPCCMLVPWPAGSCPWPSGPRLQCHASHGHGQQWWTSGLQWEATVIPVNTVRSENYETWKDCFREQVQDPSENSQKYQVVFRDFPRPHRAESEKFYVMALF